MKKWMAWIALGSLLVASPAAGAEYGNTVKSTSLVRSTTDVAGQPIRYPAPGDAEVTVLKIEIPPGGETGWHQHRIPVYAYILTGEIVVDMKGAGSRTYRAGDAFIEVVGLPHNGRNTGNVPVKLIAFYSGIKGQSNVEKPPEETAKP